MTLVALLLGGCTAKPADCTQLVASGGPSPFVDAVLNVAVDGVEGEAFVEYGQGDFALVTPTDASGAHHDLTVLGLAAGESYDWRAVVVAADGTRCESPPDSFTVPATPPKLFPTTIVTNDPSAQTRFVLGNVVRTNDGISFAAILDRDGRWVWWVDSGGKLITSPKLSLDGRSVLFNEYDFREQDIVGTIVRVSLDGRTRTETNIPYGHHDFLEQADGTFAFINMAFAEFDFGAETATLGSDQISTVVEGVPGPTPIFSMFDDFPLEPVLTCDHMRPAGGPDDLFGTPAYEWTHSNSLMYLPETDAYYVLQKYTDWLFKIPRSSMSVAWVMNGRSGDFDHADGPIVWDIPTDRGLWSHAHMSQIWADGGLIFDNGDHHQPEVSRAIEFAYDEGAKTMDIVWEFAHPGGDHTAVMGDVRLLPEDHRLVTWSELGSMTEVTPAGEIVWEADWTRGPALDAIVGRIVPIDDLYLPDLAIP